MNIILKNISANTSSDDIEGFVLPAIEGGFFKTKGVLENISIYKHIILSSNSNEYYALVTIEPDAVAKRAIIKLHRQKLHGKFIRVDEFHDRHWSNERRHAGVQIDTSLRGKRRGERRRKQKIMVLSRTDSSFDFFNQADEQDDVWGGFNP